MSGTELWLVDFEQAGVALESLEAATPRLSADQLLRIDAMENDAARRERRLAHIALRLILERRIGAAAARRDFVRGPEGKPSLAGAGIGFSLAHTQGLALIAVGPDPIGVDIERAREVRMSDARRAPIESEAIDLARGAPLAAVRPDARFLSAWVRVEAAAKAEGHGLGPLLERLRPAVVVREGGARAVVAHDIAVPDGVFAAIALAPGERLPPLRILPTTAAAIAALLADRTDR